MEPTPLKSVPTNNARDSKGWAFGLEGNQFLPVVIVGVASLGLGTVCMLTRTLGIFASFAFIVTPPALVYAYFALFRRGKPAHSDVDYLVGLLMPDAWGRGEKQPLYPYLQPGQGDEPSKEAPAAG
jgi:hypothetical protein